ncbi:MFS transporter [Bacillus thuringiensis]|uniref:MFS transporter n=1 Tax=Bacillus thuringiensis TaxID=1428 RepID=UPI000BF94202|nr:MFS transporter [Bacillus thuringiensis]PFE92817.1 MFS transporter [Bacillus thuringiensis]
MNSFYIFKNKSFFSFFITSLIGMFGEGIFSLTTIIIIAKDTDSVIALSYMFILTMLPSVFLAPIVGVIIDRFNKVKIAIVCNIARFSFIIMIPLFSYMGFSNVTIVYLSIFLSYIVWYILGPTTESVVKELLNENEYIQGTSFIQAAWQVGLLSSAVIAGILLKYLGANITLLITSFVYLLGAFLYFKLLRNYEIKKQDNHEGNGVRAYLKDIKNGWSYFSKNKALLYIGLSACIVTPFFSAINILIAPFNFKILNGSEFTLGIIDSAAGIGSFISVAFCLWLADKKGLPYYLMLSFLLLGAFTVLFSTSTYYLIAFGLYIVIGFFIGNIKVLSKSLIYKYVHESFVGRIMTLISMLGLALGIIVAIIIGYIGEKNILHAYYIVGMLLIIPVILTALGMYELKKQKIQVQRDKASILHK